jgi:aldehyde dehydrogenase (NAD+)
VCGDTVVWKPSHGDAADGDRGAATSARACWKRHGWEGVFTLADRPRFDRGRGPLLADKPRAAGERDGQSTRMGYRVAESGGAAAGPHDLLELGGNNGVILTESANLELALRAIVFGAIGTAGQRCTTIRRLLVQRRIAASFTERLVAAYGRVRVGDPLDGDADHGTAGESRCSRTRCCDASIEWRRGRRRGALRGIEFERGCYRGADARARETRRAHPVQRRVFAPILYVIEYGDLEQAIRWHNDVPQGLSSAIFTSNL